MESPMHDISSSTAEKCRAKSTGRLFLAFLFLALFFSGAYVHGEGYFADQFRLVPVGEPEVELTSYRSDFDSLLDFDFSNNVTIRGQNSSYWTAVNNQPTYVAQSASGVSAADQAPTLGGTSSSSTAIAPPADLSTLTPSSGTVAPPAPTDTSTDFFSEPVQTMKRFWEGTSFSYTFIPKGGNTGLGMHDFDFNMQFNFPCKCLSCLDKCTAGTANGANSYWYISPNIGFQLWNAPSDQFDAPSSTFDASLGFGMQPQFNKEIGADLWVQLGVAATCQRVDCDSFFVRGRGLAKVKINEQATILAGAAYYGRNAFKLLPAGGVHWIPNEKNDLYLVFPNPRISHYLANMNGTKWWGYLQGDIGGGRWRIHNNLGVYNLDYNDYRVGVGAQFECPTGFNGFIEVGAAFAREFYGLGTALYKPKTGFYLKTGFAF